MQCVHHTKLITPWSRVLLEKLTGSQLIKKFSAFYGTRKFITAFTSVRYLSLSSNRRGNCDCNPESIWKKFAKIGAECICWTEHSASKSAQNSKGETARACLQDSGGTDVAGRRLPCENGFLSRDYIEYYRVLLHSWRADLFWWSNFPHQWQIQLQQVGKGETSRCLATWKRLPRIKMCFALRKSRIVDPFFLKEATVNSEFYPALLQGFLIPELRQLDLLRLKLLSARRCTLPLCFECGTVTE